MPALLGQVRLPAFGRWLFLDIEHGDFANMDVPVLHRKSATATMRSLDQPTVYAPMRFPDEPVVFVLDVGLALIQSLRSVALPETRLECHTTIDAFFAACSLGQRGCLFADLERFGLGLLAQFHERRIQLPVVLVTERCDMATGVQAMKAGALNCLSKSSNPETLAAALDEALQWNAANHQRLQDQARAKRRRERLTPGERELLDLLVAGRSNTEAADQLRRSIRAIEARRSKVMTKMHATSLANLIYQVFLADQAS